MTTYAKCKCGQIIDEIYVGRRTLTEAMNDHLEQDHASDIEEFEKQNPEDGLGIAFDIFYIVYRKS